MQSIILLTAGGAVVGAVDEGAAEAEGAAEFFTNHIISFFSRMFEILL